MWLVVWVDGGGRVTGVVGVGLGRVVVGLAGLLVALGGLALLPVAGAHGGGPEGEPVDPASRVVDIDLVLGGAWVTYADGGVVGVDLVSGPVVRLPERSAPLELGEGERAVGLVLSGRGYWLFTSTGRVFAVGDAVPLGDLSGASLNSPIVAAAPTQSGGGYYMLGADGGVFAFGDAVFYGSVQGIVDEVHGAGALASEHLTAPVVTLATTPAGYWLVAADGAVFPFGDAPYHGSIQDAINTGNQLTGIERDWSVTPPVAEGAQLARDALEAPIVDVVPAADGTGYLMLASDGGVFNFGVSQFHGSAAGELVSPAVASDVTESRSGYVLITQQGDARTFGAVGADRSTLEGLLADARERREWAVGWLTKKIESGEYGVGSDNVLRGPAGFQIDLNDCPEGWTDTTGITNNQIRIGHSTPFPNIMDLDIPQGSFLWGSQESFVSLAFDNYIQWVNQTDPIVIDGTAHKIALETKLDQGVATFGIRNLSNLAQTGGVFSILSGDPRVSLGVYETLNRGCIPNPFALHLFRSSVFSSPQDHPWSSDLGFAATTEAYLWGTWIQKNLEDQLPLRVTALISPTREGAEIREHLTTWVEQNPSVISDLVIVEHQPWEVYDTGPFWDYPDITGTIDEVLATDPDVYIEATTRPGDDSVHAALQNGLFSSVEAAFVRSRSNNWPHFGYYGEKGVYDGWLITRGGRKGNQDENYAMEPFIHHMNQNLLAAGFDVEGSPFNPVLAEPTEGYFAAYPYVEALRIASSLPGGLSRTNFMLAVRSLEIYHPLLIDGLTFSMWGNDDPYGVEGSDISQFHSSIDRWVVRSVVDLNGQTPTQTIECAWNESTERVRCDQDH